MVYHTLKDWNTPFESATISWTALLPPLCSKEGLMLAARHHRFARNPYFQFHPLHTAFSLLGALILFGILIWFLAVPAK